MFLTKDAYQNDRGRRLVLSTATDISKSSPGDLVRALVKNHSEEMGLKKQPGQEGY